MASSAISSPFVVPAAQGDIWEDVFAEDGSSVANLTQASGSWSSTGSEIQVAPAASYVIAYETGMDFAYWEGLALSCDVKMRTGGSHAGINRVGLYTCGDASGGSGGVIATLSATGNTPASTGLDYAEDNFGLNTVYSASHNFNLDTWYRIAVVVTKSEVLFYREGLLVTVFAPVLEGAVHRAGLVAYNCEASFRNLKAVGFSISQSPSITWP